MAQGKVRAEAHMIDEDAIAIIKRKLPREWVIRELTPDYGLDLDVELFEKEDSQIVTLGERLYIQVKGTTDIRYKNITKNIRGKKLVKKCVAFSLDTDLLKLVERVGDSLPILLTVVDINSDEAYFVSLNDYINFVLCEDKKWQEQKTKTIYLPCENKIEQTELLRWYAIRPKLNNFFAEFAAFAADAAYESEPEGYIELAKKFALKFRNSDVWNCEKFGFCFLEDARRLIEDVTNGRNCSECSIMFRNFSESDYVSIGQYKKMFLSTAKKLFTAKRLIENLENTNCIFMSCMRQCFTITEYEAMMSI